MEFSDEEASKEKIETNRTVPHPISVHAEQRAVSIGGSVTNSQILTGDVLIEKPSGGTLPPLPTLLTGRDQDLLLLKSRLGIGKTESDGAITHSITVIRGWVGVGKTTLAAALAHDSDVSSKFPDGVLWTSLGQTPSLLAELAAWGRSLGSHSVARALDVKNASSQLAAMVRNKRILLLVDDVWQSEHAEAFKIGGTACSSIFTTRSDAVAQKLASTPNDIYRLDVLSSDFSFELLKQLAPEVVYEHESSCRELVNELGGLPLALQVAGRLLHTESRLGWGVNDLLDALRAGKKLLEAQAPSDRADMTLGTTPTIAVLLEKSTDRLAPEMRDRFAMLGVFAPEPATFDLPALEAMWLTDPKDAVREFVARGLLEPITGASRFQIHALLALHARSMLTE